MSTAAETQAFWQRVHEQTADVLFLAERHICPACSVALIEHGALLECPNEDCGFYRFLDSKQGAA
jgi:hypothetical protein